MISRETGMDTQTELRHARREIRTALELAIVALAPADLLDELAAIAGLFEAFEELPLDSAAMAALCSHTLRRAQTTLEACDHCRDKRAAQG